MRKVWMAICIVSTLLVVIWIGSAILASYEYERDIASYWSLADKASTLQQKADYIDKFVNVLSNSGLAGSNNALVLKTANNSFDRNIEALKSLQGRMSEIKGMDVQSFQYQQAISQITAQEQGEARSMLGVFEGCWYLRHHFLLWDWLGVVIILTLICLSIGAGVGIAVAD